VPGWLRPPGRQTRQRLTGAGPATSRTAFPPPGSQTRCRPPRSGCRSRSRQAGSPAVHGNSGLPRRLRRGPGTHGRSGSKPPRSNEQGRPPSGAIAHPSRVPTEDRAWFQAGKLEQQLAPQWPGTLGLRDQIARLAAPSGPGGCMVAPGRRRRLVRALPLPSRSLASNANSRRCGEKAGGTPAAGAGSRGLTATVARPPAGGLGASVRELVPSSDRQG